MSDRDPVETVKDQDTRPGLDRREVLAVGVVGTALATSSSGAVAQVTAPAMVPSDQPLRAAVRMTVNGQVEDLSIDTRASLLDVLREQLGLNGPKKGCDHGQCGACTVHVEGRRVLSCLTQAVKMDGRDVLTIEGLAPAGGALHPMQQAFIDHDALQCGYCTPGQILSAIACVKEGHAGSAAEVREYMSGNLCRCGAYVGIVNAVLAAAPRMGSV